MRKVAPRRESPSFEAKSSVFNASRVFERRQPRPPVLPASPRKAPDVRIGDGHQLFRLRHLVHQALAHLRRVDTFAHALGQSEMNEARHLVVLGFADEFQRNLPLDSSDKTGKIDFRAFPISSKAFSGSIRLTIVRISSMSLL